MLLCSTCTIAFICYVYFCNRMTHGYFFTFRGNFENNFLFEKNIPQEEPGQTETSIFNNGI